MSNKENFNLNLELIDFRTIVLAILCIAAATPNYCQLLDC